MLLVIPFCEKDRLAAIRLLEWIGQLGKDNWHHSALLVAATTVSREGLMQAMSMARSIFGGVQGVHQVHADERGWPMSCNAMFRTALDYIEHEACTPFFWCEPDCVPMQPDWLDQLQKQYLDCGKPLMGALYDQPWPHLTGCAVYPPDYRNINPQALKADKQPWDVVAPEIILPLTHVTPLIQHVWGKGKEPPTFNGESSLSILNKDAVVFHRCKDGTLIDSLRKRLNIPKPVEKNEVVIRRTGALGDVLLASAVATRIQSLGFNVVFQSSPSTHPVLRRIVPKIAKITELDGRSCHINLDEAYEVDAKRKENMAVDSYFNRAAAFAAKSKLSLGLPRNWAPKLSVTPTEKALRLKKLNGHTRPWTVICPRSNSHATRTVPDHLWKEIADGVEGTKFWLGTHGPAPAGIVDLECKTVSEVIESVAVADLMISAETGPMHFAAALGVPLVVIEQATRPEWGLSDQRDWIKVSPQLNCLNCQSSRCHIKPDAPPCQNVPVGKVIEVANRKLKATEADVSIAISIYKPPTERLNRCLTAALPQTNDVVIVWDKAGEFPENIIRDPKIRKYKHWQTDIGYGRKMNFAMRHTYGNWVLMLNDDCYLYPDSIAKMMECAKEDVGMVSALLFYPSGKIQHGGTIRAPGQHGWHHLDVGQTESRFKEPVEMENVTGACVLVNRKAFYEAGGFDEEFYLCCEDNDLCMKLRQAGYRIMFQPHAKGVHEESVSTRSTPNFAKIVDASIARLERKWSWYWEKNKNNELGVF